MDWNIAPLLADPAAWAALLTLIVMEVVLGIDNLIFISILTNKLPEAQRARARRIGISLALVLRLALLSTIAFIVGLTAPVFDLGIQGGLDPHGNPEFETAFSWRDIILAAGGLFLVWKATKEIHHSVDPTPSHDLYDKKAPHRDEFRRRHLPDPAARHRVFDRLDPDRRRHDRPCADHDRGRDRRCSVMMLAADPVANFINRNPTIVMLALGFLLMIGMVLIAEGFGVHVPKGYIYAAMAFSALVEGLNMMSRNAEKRREKQSKA